MKREKWIPKFLIAFDRDYKRKFIVHAQEPHIFVEIEDNKLDVEIALKECGGDPNVTGIIMRMKDWFTSLTAKQFAPGIKNGENKFLMTVDPNNKELYILHRQFPACLLWVKQEIPARFILQDLYDEVKNVDEIIGMPFIQEAKDFYKNYSENIIGGN